MSSLLNDKILLITGGTGSFGTTVVKKFIETNVAEIRIFSRDEKKQEDLRIQLSNEKLKFFIGDVRDYESVNQAMKGADFVFHAAALKQVPSCEFYPIEAVKTNILGAENVLNASVENKIKKTIVLSTDKAVYPINAMGMSKALMEKLMVAKARLQKDNLSLFGVTRYGNVMGSRGSVIPLFINQIKSGNSITVTDPTMTRFLMSLQDSVELVFHAFENLEQGDLFVQKAPACTILDLANALIEIFNSKVDIKTIGTRHGEKLFESLLGREEMFKAKDLGRFYKVPMDGRDLNYSKYFTEGKSFDESIEDYTSHNTERLDIEGTKRVLLSLDIIQKEISA